MPEMMGTLASVFTKAAPLLEGGMAGAGLIGNILNEKARSDELGYLKNQQKQLQDPTALAKQVVAATQPLSQGLIQGVENTVSGSLAEQGLSQAPGIQAATLSQALAPFYQQNQNTALQLVMRRLGLPMEYAQTYLAGLPQNSNLSPLLALLMRNNNPSSTSGGVPGIIPDLSAGYTPPEAIFTTPPFLPGGESDFGGLSL